MKFKCTLTVNYPDAKEIEAAIPAQPINIFSIGTILLKLVNTEPDMTSFTLIAVPVKE